MRVRALAALLSTEIFGVAVALPELPRMKSIRGIGMSDSPQLAERLAEKFDYTNTFYHQAPFFDVARAPENEAGRYDFVFSSEVMEHVAPPVEDAFAALARVLKRDGLLLLTTPYTIDGKTVEHFPQLHEYALASPGGHTVLVNRRRDGSLEVFENLVFHGGDGSTVEVRVFSQESLRTTLLESGFSNVRVAAEDFPEFGVRHAEDWSLPFAVRKGAFKAFPAGLACEYRDAARKASDLERQLASLRRDYQSYIEFHETSHRDQERELAARAEWAQKMEGDLEERTRWAMALKHENEDALAKFEQARKSEAEAWQRVETMERELGEARARRALLESRMWTRVGRKLGAVP
jgi:SAM-dependent methyltransferase